MAGVRARVTIGTHKVLTQVNDYAYAQDAMPTDVTDTSAGVGQVSATVPVWAGSRRTAGQTFTVEAANLPDGGVTGTVTDPADDGVNVVLTSFSVLGRLNAIKRLAPYSGSLTGALTAFLTAAAITDYTIDAAFLTVPVDMIGFTDNLWVKLRELAAVHHFEVRASGTHVDVLKRDWSYPSSTAWKVIPAGISSDDIPAGLHYPDVVDWASL